MLLRRPARRMFPPSAALGTPQHTTPQSAFMTRGDAKLAESLNSRPTGPYAERFGCLVPRVMGPSALIRWGPLAGGNGNEAKFHYCQIDW